MTSKSQFIEEGIKYRSRESQYSQVKSSVETYKSALNKGLVQFSNLDLARKRAANIKRRVLDHWDEYLVEFESNFTQNGGHLYWAIDKEEALKHISQIAEEHGIKSFVKSKSMLTEEIGFNDWCESSGKKVFETDLGEYIQQLAKEKPYHPVTPSVHQSHSAIKELFKKELELEFEEPTNNKQLVDLSRQALRSFFVKADAGLTGANFLISETGSIAVTENESNLKLSAASRDIHIIIGGIERIIPELTDLDLFWPLLSSHGTGQSITAYNTLITPTKNGNKNKKVYLILLDNGRTELYQNERKREALSCIRCGACHKVCPVYKSVGGYAYGEVYNGPIGNIINPYLHQSSEEMHLSGASSLCGACSEICPVNIPLHNIFIESRNEKEYHEGMDSSKYPWLAWKYAMLSRKRMNKSPKIKQTALNLLFRKKWGEQRELPQFAKKSFNKMWEEDEATKKTI